MLEQETEAEMLRRQEVELVVGVIRVVVVAAEGEEVMPETTQQTRVYPVLVGMPQRNQAKSVVFVLYQAHQQ